jgi:hypothetical protein
VVELGGGSRSNIHVGQTPDIQPKKTVCICGLQLNRLPFGGRNDSAAWYFDFSSPRSSSVSGSCLVGVGPGLASEPGKPTWSIVDRCRAGESTGDLALAKGGGVGRKDSFARFCSASIAANWALRFISTSCRAARSAFTDFLA